MEVEKMQRMLDSLADGALLSPIESSDMKAIAARFKALNALWAEMQSYGFWEDKDFNEACYAIERLEGKRTDTPVHWD